MTTVAEYFEGSVFATPCCGRTVPGDMDIGAHGPEHAGMPVLFLCPKCTQPMLAKKQPGSVAVCVMQPEDVGKLHPSAVRAVLVTLMTALYARWFANHVAEPCSPEAALAHLN